MTATAPAAPPPERPVSTKDAIARAALGLFVSKGLTETTTREIASEAGIAEGTIYRHFESKEALAFHLYRSIHAAMAERLSRAIDAEDGFRPKLRAGIRAFCEMADAQPAEISYHMLYQFREFPGIDDDLPDPVKVIRQLMLYGMERGEIPNREREFALAMGIGVVYQVLRVRHYNLLQRTMAEYADVLATAVERVLLTPLEE